MNPARRMPQLWQRRKAHRQWARGSPHRPRILNWRPQRQSRPRSRARQLKSPCRSIRPLIQSMPKKCKSRSKLQSHLRRHQQTNPSLTMPQTNQPPRTISNRPRSQRRQLLKTLALLMKQRQKNLSYKLCKKLVVCRVKMPARPCLLSESAWELKMQRRLLAVKQMSPTTRLSLR